MSPTSPPPDANTPVAPLRQMVQTAAALGLAERLATGAREVGELAAECGTDPKALARLLQGLASLGLVAQTGPRRFAPTPMAELMRRDRSTAMRLFVRRRGEEHSRSWDERLDGVRSGESAFRDRHGCTVLAWSQRAAHSPSASIGINQVPT